MSAARERGVATLATMRRAPFGRTLGALCAALCLLASAAQASQDSLWLREPAISPDGARIAFRFQGQIWIAPTAGGDALALTPAGFHAASPVWSPSGDSIAFATDRFGAMNIFIAPAAGGEAKRLTWYSFDQQPSSFTSDGKAVLFSSRQLGDAVQTSRSPANSRSRTSFTKSRSREAASGWPCPTPRSTRNGIRRSDVCFTPAPTSSSRFASGRRRAPRARSGSMTRRPGGTSA